MNIWMVLFQVFNAVSAIYIHCLFFGAFYEKREFKLRRLTLIGLAIILSTVLIFMPASTIRSLTILIMIFILSFLYGEIWYKNLLLTFMIFCLPGLIELLIAMSLTVLGVNVSQIDQSIFLIIGVLISKIITFTCVQFIKVGKHKLRNISVWYYISFSLLALCSTLISIIILDYLYLNDKLYLKIVAIISIWLLILANVLVFYVIDRINSLYVTEQNLTLSKTILKEQKEHYKDVIVEQKNIAKMRHDIKNSLIGILTELNNNNTNQAKLKLEHIFEDIGKSNAEILINDPTLNTILVIKKKVISEYNIEFECNDHLTSEIKIDSLDLCIIIGNILDNAIEACNKITHGEKRITLFFTTKGKNLVVAAQNTVSKRVDVQSLVTTKQDKKYHGFGIARIQELVEKYNGNIDISCDDRYFEMNLVILNE